MIGTMLYIPLLFLLGLQQPAQGSLLVIVQNIEVNTSETVRIGLYNSAESFLNENSEFKGKVLPASHTSLNFLFEGLSPGSYAVAAYQDENNDGVLNTNFLGAPKENYGFSQNPNIWFRVPAFEDCKVRVEPGRQTSIVIEL